MAYLRWQLFRNDDVINTPYDIITPHPPPPPPTLPLVRNDKKKSGLDGGSFPPGAHGEQFHVRKRLLCQVVGLKVHRKSP